MARESRQKILVSPIGDIDPDVLAQARTRIKSLFGLPTEVLSVLDSLDFAFDPDRNQYHSTPILEKLSAAAPARALKVVGLTREDLFIPILTYVYGEAQLGGRTCVLSTFRLTEGLSLSGGGALYRERVSKEAVHELGHTFNLRHCQDPSCLMHYCRTVRDVDRKSGQLCRYCSVLLEDALRAGSTEQGAGGSKK